MSRERGNKPYTEENFFQKNAEKGLLLKIHKEL